MYVSNSSTVPESYADTVLFISLVTDAIEAAHAGLLIDSLRDFGGPFSDCAVWVFYPEKFAIDRTVLSRKVARLVPFRLPQLYSSFLFAEKPYVAAKAEEMLLPGVRCLAWLDHGALILNSPNLYVLDPDFDAALRPVYVKNIGLLANDPLDGYWKAVYQAAGLEDDGGHTVASVTDGKVLRPYFNCGQYAMNSSMGIFRRWWKCFERLVNDADFQAGACQDEEHQIFLHQAAFSAVIMKNIDWERIRRLPPEYGYPFHHRHDLPAETRLSTAKRAVVGLTYGDLPDPEHGGYREVSEFLAEWVREHLQKIK